MGHLGSGRADASPGTRSWQVQANAARASGCEPGITVARDTSGIGCAIVGLQNVHALLDWIRVVMTPPTFPERPPVAPDQDVWADDDFWAAFDVEDDDLDRPLPWYRKFARVIAGLIVVGMVATGALIPWRTWIDRLDDVSDPIEIRELATETVDASPYEWLVTGIQVRSISSPDIGGFVNSSPADGIINIDLRGWDPDELRSVVSHEIGHLIDFAAYGQSAERRDGLSSEVWAECAAVDAGSRRVDGDAGDTPYHCTRAELEQYRFAMSRLGEVCRSWGVVECRVVEPIGNDP